MGCKYTGLAGKNKIFSAVSGNTDKNYSDWVCSQRVIEGASLHKGDVLLIPFFFGLPGIESYSYDSYDSYSYSYSCCELERC